MKRLAVWPIADHEVLAAVQLISAGSLGQSVEDVDHLKSYAAAIVETRKRGGEVFVADLEGEVVGVCQVIVFRHLQHRGERCAEIESVHVRSDLRSKGIGAALLRTTEKFAVTQGCYRIQLTSNNQRVDAHRFYATNGYAQSHQGFKKNLTTD
jgi:GNAT superfamily N-acetyltransferase